MLGPGKVHTWQLSKDIDGYIFFHTREFYDFNFTYEKVENYPFFSSLRNSPLIALNRTDQKKLEPVFKEVVEEYRQNELMKFQKIASLVNVLYIALARKYLPLQLREKQNLYFLAKVKKFRARIPVPIRPSIMLPGSCNCPAVDCAVPGRRSGNPPGAPCPSHPHGPRSNRIDLLPMPPHGAGAAGRWCTKPPARPLRTCANQRRPAYRLCLRWRLDRRLSEWRLRMAAWGHGGC